MFILDVYNTIAKNNDIEIDTSKSSREIFNLLVSEGILAENIAKEFSTASHIPYCNIENRKPDMVTISKYGIDFFKENKCFPFLKDKTLNVAVSDPSTIANLDALFKDREEYVPYYCFDFIIVESLSAIEKVDNSSLDVIEIREDSKQNVLLATNQVYIDRVIAGADSFKSKYSVVGSVFDRDNLIDMCRSTMPDIVLLSDTLVGKVQMKVLIIRLKTTFPNARIIYFVGNIDVNDNVRRNDLSILSASKACEIVEGSKLSVSQLKTILERDLYADGSESAPLYNLPNSENKQEIKINAETTIDEENVLMCKNVYSFISPKGGVGKSTLVGNIAVAIKKYASENAKGKKPTVAIIDLDTQFFQLSVQFDTFNKERNLFTALESAKRIVESNDALSQEELYECNEIIRQSLVQSSKFKNIFILGNNGLANNPSNDLLLTNDTLTYIVEYLSSLYDIVLVDVNTTIECKYSFVLYHLSRCVYNVFDFSVQSINANNRFFNYLKEQNLYHHINNKVIVNKTFEVQNSPINLVSFNKNLNEPADIFIPYIDNSIRHQTDCAFNFIITDDNPICNAFNAGILKIANEITSINNFEALYSRLSACNVQKQKGKFFSFLN